MGRAFKQHEFEAAIYKVLAYGDETRIAEETGKGASLYSQMFNPDDERESNLFKAATEIAALIKIDKDRGLEILRLFTGFAERALAPELPSDEAKLLTSVIKAELELHEVRGLAERLSDLHGFAKRVTAERKK